jgi:uncharacterized membrane protein (UPF0182 family)
MSAPTSIRRPRIRLWVLGAVLALLVILALSLRGLATLYTDALWFNGAGFGPVWKGLISAKMIPAAIFTVAFFALLWVNLTIASRLAPPPRDLTPEDDLLNRYDHVTGPYAGRIRIAVAAFFALVAGANVASHWEQWVLFRNAGTFGQKDPQFGIDIGFFVFRLPFLQFVVEWTFAAFVIVFILTLIAHYLNGGIRLQPPHQRVTPHVKAHLSVLLGMTAFVRAGQYFLDRFDLAFSSRGVVDGATYTDIKAQLPALNLLIFIAVVAGGLFLVNIWRRGWVLPIIAVGLWAFVAIIVGSIYPAIVQQFQVKPNELAREKPYIQRNIDATREAFAVNDQYVETRPFPYQDYLKRNPETGQRPNPAIAQTVVLDNTSTINNARLWDPEMLRPSFQNQQGFRSFDIFSSLAVDRYDIGGTRFPMLVAGRELNADKLPSSTWTSKHLFYTHGYGAVGALGNEVTTDNAPRYTISGIPPKGPLQESTQPRPEIYYGEGLSGYVITNTNQPEFQPSGSDATEAGSTTFSGGGGIQLSNIVRRAAVAMRVNDINPLISSQVTSKSRVLLERDVRSRVQTVAPFLALDSTPYLVLADGKQTWVIDGYTTSDRYPYSQQYSSQDLDPTSGLRQSLNYVRNSVKATVDAYDGSVRLYVVDATDPVLKAYRRAFPDLFTPVSAASPALTAHFRYPVDLFRLQSDVMSQYHVTDPAEFYGGEPFWAVSADPGSGTVDLQELQNAASTIPTSTTVLTGGRATRLKSEGARQIPSYQLMRMPGGTTAQEFVLMRAFVPVNRETQLSAFMAARSDALPDGQRKLVVYTVPKDSGAPTPVIVDRQIKADPSISPIFTLLDQRGSKVIQGNLQLLPIGDTIVWVRPIYVQGTGADSYPQYTYVAVTYGDRAVLQRSVGAAIQQLFFGGPSLVEIEAQGTTSGGGATKPTTPSGVTTTAALLDQANQKYADAQTALKAGDLGKYQQLIDEAGRLIAQARQSVADATTTTTAAAGR